MRSLQKLTNRAVGLIGGVLLLTAGLASCHSEGGLGDAADSVTQFMDGLQKGDSTVLAKYFPTGKLNASDCYKPKAYEVDSIVYEGPEAKDGKGDKATAYVSFSYTNAKNVDFDRHMQLSVQRTGKEGTDFKVVATKGLVRYAEEPIFNFANKVGGVKDVDDTEMMRNLAICNAYRNSLVEEQRSAIDNGWYHNDKYQWWNGTNRINFSGTCSNSANVTIPNVKAILTVYCDGRTVVRQEANIGNVEPGHDYSYYFETFVLQKIVSSTFWNSNVSFSFDDSFISKIVDNKKYAGNEFDAFKEAHRNDLDALIRQFSLLTTEAQYVGTIGKDAVTMKLNIKNGKITGTYYYNKKGPKNVLQLEGTVDHTGNISINETNSKGKQTGLFFLDSQMKGTFMTPNSPKVFDVKLKKNN